MDAECDLVNDYSIALSRALDAIGLNAVTVKKRRETYLYIEDFTTLFLKLSGHGHVTSYNFGSQSEGTTTLGLNSDADTLSCQDDHSVIQKMSEWTPGTTNLLMLQEDTAPGYCRLQLLKEDKREPEVTPPREGLVYDTCSRVIMKNTIFEHGDVYEGDVQRNGPAQTYTLPYCQEEDSVPAFRCTTSLPAVETWAKRPRRGDWPSQDLIKQVVGQTAFVVPVGHKLSKTPDMEFRISTSLAERCLMFSLNNIQIKCYALLKILVKECVTPHVGKCLTSFHCKTAVFYCAESTDSEFWREDNMLHCVTRCLRKLHAWVADRVCPHYILADANLFAGKVTPHNKDAILFRLDRLIRNIRDALQNISTDRLGQVLSRKLGPNSNDPMQDSTDTIIIHGRLEYMRHNHIALGSMRLMLISSAQAQEPHALRANLKKRLNELISYKQNANDLERKVITQFIGILSRYLGSRLASSELCCNDRIPQEALNLQETGATNNISARLKQASVLYCSGDLEKVELLLREIAHQVSKYCIQHTCMCIRSRRSDIREGVYCQLTCLGLDETERDGLFAHCVMFSEHEIFCTPPALRYEFFRSVRGEDQTKVHDDWMALAVVDAIPFLYFLQFITYRQLKKSELQFEANRNIEASINKGDIVLNHPETAWNLLGQCYEMDGWPNSALDCYRRSIKIRPNNNAANWLMSSLIHKYI